MLKRVNVFAILVIAICCLAVPAHANDLLAKNSVPSQPESQALPRVPFMVAEQNIGQELAIFGWSWFGQGSSQFVGQTVDMAISESVIKDAFLGQGFDKDIDGLEGGC